MRHSLLLIVAVTLLAGCGTTPTGMSARALSNGTLAARSADSDKHAVTPPQPAPLTQGFSASDVTAVAAAAYAQAFHAKTPQEAQQTASVALQKIVALMPESSVAKEVVPFAQALLKASISDGENQRRVALWPLLYISKGLVSSQDPTFFELQGKTMESMLNWKDGLAVGLVAFDVLNDSPNGYVKTMADKALANFKNPSSDLQASYKMMLATLKDISDTIKTVNAAKLRK